MEASPESGCLDAEQQPEQRGLAGAVGAGDADPLPGVELQVHRSQGEVALADDGVAQGCHDGAGARRLADAELQLPFLARLLHLVQPGDAGFHLPDLLGLLFGGLGAGGAADLVVVRALLHGVPDALGAPFALGAGAGDQVRLGGGELLVPFAGVAAGDGALLQEGLVAAVVDRHRVLGEVQFHDRGDAAGQELAVVGDQRPRRRAGPARRPPAWPGRPGQGRWWVRPAARRRSGSAAGRRAPRGRPARRRARSSRRRGPHPGQGPPGRAGCGHPGPRRRRPSSGRRPGSRRRRRPGAPEPSASAVDSISSGRLGAAGAPGDVAGDGFAGDPFVFLRQPAHKGVGRARG